MSTIQNEFEFVNIFTPNKLLDIYKETLPYRSLCTDYLGSLVNMPKEKALLKRYLQHNPPGSISCLVIDYDNTEAHYRWDDLHAPPPNFAVMNPDNGHCHLLYMIRNRVYKNRADNLKPFRYLSAIETALIKKLGADPSYTNLISKNPFNDYWVLYELQKWTYDLDNFLDYLILPKKTISEGNLFEHGLGRNCTVFDQLRLRAYSLIRELNFKISLDLFISELFKIAYYGFNTAFLIPLSSQEINCIAKSVGKWVYTHYSNDEFIAFCSRRGKKSGVVRLEKASQLYKEIKEIKLSKPAMSNRSIAKLLNISEGTVRNALKYVEPSQDDKELFIEQPSLIEL